MALYLHPHHVNRQEGVEDAGRHCECRGHQADDQNGLRDARDHLLLISDEAAATAAVVAIIWHPAAATQQLTLFRKALP